MEGGDGIPPMVKIKQEVMEEEEESRPSETGGYQIFFIAEDAIKEEEMTQDDVEEQLRLNDTEQNSLQDVDVEMPVTKASSHESESMEGGDGIPPMVKIKQEVIEEEEEHRPSETEGYQIFFIAEDAIKKEEMTQDDVEEQLRRKDTKQNSLRDVEVEMPVTTTSCQSAVFKMSFEHHIEALKSLCRVCGQKVHAGEKFKAYATLKYRKELLAVFNLNTFRDEDDVHPKHLCRRCLRRVQQYAAGRTQYWNEYHRNHEWKKHLPNNCPVCHQSWKPIPRAEKKNPQIKTKIVHDSKADSHFLHVTSIHKDIPRSLARASDVIVPRKLQEDGQATIQTPGKPIHVKACSTEPPKKIQRKCTEENLDAANALAMMDDVQLMGSQYGETNRHNEGNFSSECKLQALSSKLQKQNFNTIYINEGANFHIDSKKTVTRLTSCSCPFVYVTNLEETLMDFLDNNDRNGFLTTHDGAIPADEVWLKFRGDYGEGLYKLAIEVCNVKKLSASHNTLIVGCYEGHDTISSLQQAIHPIAKQLKQLKKKKWRGKKIRIFCCGDYESLIKTYGIISCSARYRCLYCLITRDDMQKSLNERVSSVERTRKSIKKDFRRFIRKGAVPSNSKEVSHSVVRKPIIPIEISDVVIPTLRVSFGIFKKIYDLFERDCLLIEKKVTQLQELPETLHPKLGPLLQGLEDTLQTFHVSRRQFHGGGGCLDNHVNQCCKPEAIAALTGSPQATLQNLQKDLHIFDEVLREAAKIGQKYSELFLAFADCHFAITCEKKMSEEEIHKTDAAIHNFMVLTRKAGIPVSPKMHMLEDHVVPQLKRFNVGLGLLNEKGLESMHEEFKHLRRRMAGIHNITDRLLAMMKAYYTSKLPSAK